MSRDLVPWVFIILLMGAGIILSVLHSQAMAECHAAQAIGKSA